MRNLLLAFIVITLPSCLGVHVRDATLIPAVQMAWTSIKVDIELGISDAVEHGDLNDSDELFNISCNMDMAVKSGIRNDIMAAPYNIIEPYAYRGIGVKIEKGELTEQTAEFLFERLTNFRHAIDKLMKETVYLPLSYKREYWVMTDRGSFYYGNQQPNGWRSDNGF